MIQKELNLAAIMCLGMNSSNYVQVLRELNFAIVDEVDSILLDESRIPMILSAKAAEETEKVELAAKVCHIEYLGCQLGINYMPYCGSSI